MFIQAVSYALKQVRDVVESSDGLPTTDEGGLLRGYVKVTVELLVCGSHITNSSCHLEPSSLHLGYALDEELFHYCCRGGPSAEKKKLAVSISVPCHEP